MSTIVVTNGSAAVDSIARLRPDDRFLPWDDVLHDGPVPSEMPLKHLSSIRARFVSECGWGPYEKILERFEKRDRLLISAREDYQEIVLWFEHDLYDQLQLVQILAELSEHLSHSPSQASVSIICHDHFVSLSEVEILAKDFRDRQPVTAAHYDLAARAWAAFTHVTPLRLKAFVDEENLSVMPFLRSAIFRWFEEYPDVVDGLGRTERAILDIVAAGTNDAPAVFQVVQDAEEAEFLGDASFSRVLERMCSEPDQLLETTTGERLEAHDAARHSLSLTALGRAVLDGTSGRVHTWREKWMGGVLLGPNNFWYWDPDAEEFVAGRL